jgi:hypothetical protein
MIYNIEAKKLLKDNDDYLENNLKLVPLDIHTPSAGIYWFKYFKFETITEMYKYIADNNMIYDYINWDYLKSYIETYIKNK